MLWESLYWSSVVDKRLAGVIAFDDLVARRNVEHVAFESATAFSFYALYRQESFVLVLIGMSCALYLGLVVSPLGSLFGSIARYRSPQVFTSTD